MDVPEPEWGMVERGRGAAVASIFSEERTLLASQEWSRLPSVRQVALQRGALWLPAQTPSLEYGPQSDADLFSRPSWRGGSQLLVWFLLVILPCCSSY